jgi:cytochrome bd-type quinol oxidase subunit 1
MNYLELSIPLLPIPLVLAWCGVGVFACFYGYLDICVQDRKIYKPTVKEFFEVLAVSFIFGPVTILLYVFSFGNYCQYCPKRW